MAIGLRTLLRVLVMCAMVLGLGACGNGIGETVGVAALATAASVAIFGKAVPDLVYSGITGKNCSVVRLEQGETYCRPIEPLPPVPRFCTHSLGVVDCWANPEALPAGTPQVADGPTTLTPEQEANRTQRWPPL